MDSATDKPALLPKPADRPVVSYDTEPADDWRLALNHPAMIVSLRLSKLVLRGVVLFAVSFIEIVAELLAPILLICGIGWSALPGILSMAGPEGQARDVIAGVAQSIPREIRVGHMVLTPATLIMDGLLLIAVVALCRTVQTIVSTEV